MEKRERTVREEYNPGCEVKRKLGKDTLVRLKCELQRINSNLQICFCIKCSHLEASTSDRIRLEMTTAAQTPV